MSRLHFLSDWKRRKMTVITTVNLPPLILQSFSSDLLSAPVWNTLEYLENRMKKIIEKASKKIRPQDTRKRKEFELLVKEFEELYERKKIEKDEYDKKKKKRREEMLFVGSTMRFKRVGSVQPGKELVLSENNARF
jgi:hypothetical protein